jgi:hypothetical protein
MLPKMPKIHEKLLRVITHIIRDNARYDEASASPKKQQLSRVDSEHPPNSGHGSRRRDVGEVN